MANSVKHYGRVYTPDWLVRQILDFGGYKGASIIGKHVIDNSCGDGAFLREIVTRYCDVYKGNDLKRRLQTFIHGVEIDHGERDKCVRELCLLAERYGATDVKWDVMCADALTVDKYNDEMGYVFGNPPYVRVHNLDTSYDIVKRFEFAQHGMTDLFIVFFEVGFRMMKTDGRMCIISPSSWFTSKAGSTLRQYIVQNRNLSGVIVLGHFQPFSATTYTAISRFERGTQGVSLYHYFDNQTKPRKIDTLHISEIQISGNFYFSDKQQLESLRLIRTGRTYRYVEVKNGFATLSDKVFIGDFDFAEGTIDVLKASTGKWSKCIFPYDEHGRPLPPSVIEQNEQVYQYLLRNKSHIVSKRDIDDENMWYLFGATDLTVNCS